ncbi:methylenetetrahydrofolate reductase [Elongatibacter sediminis]|uniref:Methylenetetrahydrofolate reductase n=1 Tax=Elongatibacter sediminis TaxID=3119006 RepID=A0AAW9RBH1_9GAMM
MKTLREALGRKTFVMSADLDLGRGTGAAEVRHQARQLAPVVDAVQVPDSHDGRLQMSVTAAAALLLAEGVDPVVHLTGRDRNRIALENDLLGLGVLGVQSVLLTRGEVLPDSYRPPTRQVLELSGTDLVTIARQLGEDESVPGVSGFHVGTAATVFAPRKGWKPKSLLERVEAGADFVQMQICFNLKSLRRYMMHLVDARLPWRCAVLAGIAVLPDVETAKRLQLALHGSAMAGQIVRRMADAVEPEREGVAIALEKILQLAEIPGISGVNLTAPGRPDLIAETVRAARSHLG